MKVLIALAFSFACQNSFAQSYAEQFEKAAQTYSQMTYSENWLHDQVESYLERRIEDGLRDGVAVVDGDIAISSLGNNKHKVEFSFLAKRERGPRYESICRASFNVTVARSQDSFRLIAPHFLRQEYIDCYRK